ncbi:hypothetical protein G6F60_015646 [Rhizopus arrhizus]|nr:hypothetical protein G6F60_015646 [Rhizopus arrhizus]
MGHQLVVRADGTGLGVAAAGDVALLEVTAGRQVDHHRAARGHQLGQFGGFDALEAPEQAADLGDDDGHATLRNSLRSRVD